MILERKTLLVLMAAYTVAGWVVCGFGVAGFYEYIEQRELRFWRGPGSVDGFFPTLGAHLHQVASDLGTLWERWSGSYRHYNQHKANALMDGVVIAQFTVMPMVIAFILVCVTAMVMRRYKGIR